MLHSMQLVLFWQQNWTSYDTNSNQAKGRKPQDSELQNWLIHKIAEEIFNHNFNKSNIVGGS